MFSKPNVNIKEKGKIYFFSDHLLFSPMFSKPNVNIKEKEKGYLPLHLHPEQHRAAPHE
jgi:hypothetical protein